MERNDAKPMSVDPVNYEACGTDELVDGVEQLHGLGCAVHAQLLQMIRALDSRQAWRADAASMADWLTLRLGLSYRDAVRLVEVADALGDLPSIAAAYAGGRLSLAKVCALVRFATPETDTDLAEEALHMNAAQLERSARRHRAASPQAVDEARAARHVTWRWGTEHSALHLSGRLPGEDGAVVVAALERLAEDQPKTSEGNYEGFGERCADALVELAAAHIAEDCDPDRATVVVHVDASTLREDTGVAEVEGGPALGPEAARRLTCDARLQRVSYDEGGRVAGVGRTSRTVPPWVARMLRHRDGGCRWPGCGRARLMQAHHIVHWARDGTTDLDNLALLCRAHHRKVHEEHWSVRGDPAHGLTFTKPDGEPLGLGPPPLRGEIRQRVLEPAALLA